MNQSNDRRIEIAEVCRVEGHEAVIVEIAGGKVASVKLEVFEGTRFFEKIVVSHPCTELPHISSRVCAICSTGHVLAAIGAIENALGLAIPNQIDQLRKLMHLGMIIESHATHIYALALPDFVKAGTVAELANGYPKEFAAWIKFRNLGSKIQSIIGGRAFHPVNLHVGGFTSHPDVNALKLLLPQIKDLKQEALDLCQLLMSLTPEPQARFEPVFLALDDQSDCYSYFGNKIKSSAGWTSDVKNYKEYLSEYVNAYSHAKASTARGQTLMVGSMARLMLGSNKLSAQAKSVFQSSPLARQDFSSLWNNLAQAIELVDALEQSSELINKLDEQIAAKSLMIPFSLHKSTGVGAIECPRGTLYHYYEIDDGGKVLAADMITPSAQNTLRIEQEVLLVADANICADSSTDAAIKDRLETLIRAYDPCNTCATHMVKLNRRQ